MNTHTHTHTHTHGQVNSLPLPQYQPSIDRSISTTQASERHKPRSSEKPPISRTKSEGAAMEKSPSNNSIKTLHLKDREGAAKQSAMAKAGGHSGFSSLRPYSLVSKMQQESALQIELKEQMLGYKRLRQSHVKQVGEGGVLCSPNS